MTDHSEEISRLAEEFQSCRKILQALGDENRQHLILEMMRIGAICVKKKKEPIYEFIRSNQGAPQCPSV